MNIYLWIPDKSGNGPDHLFQNGKNINSDKMLTKKLYSVYKNVSNSNHVIYNNEKDKIIKLNNSFLINFYTDEDDIIGRIMPVIIIIEEIDKFKSEFITLNIHNILKNFPITYSDSKLDKLMKIVYEDKGISKSKYIILIIAIIVLTIIIFLILNNR